MSEFVQHLKEVFEAFGPIETRRMFGGYGVYYEGLMFGLVSEDTLFLKADEHNVHEFETLGLAPFEYERANKTVKLSYYMAPDHILEDQEQAALWAQSAYEAALRAQA